MSDQVQQIKDRLNIVDVIGQYVKLTKAGKNYKGLSPFGKEKTPSFFVNPEKGMYYDFSSGQGGDIFSFVEKIEGVDFKKALEMLAEKAGIELVQESPGTRDLRNSLYSVLEEASQFFETKLSERDDALSYLEKRGLEKATMRGFRLGFAPDAWQELFDHLTKKGFSDSVIDKAGLAKKGDRGQYYDRFRSRIMFPIMDPSGKIIAFSGRIFGEAAKDDKNAKYLNSPETPLFDKSRVLYGFHKAKQFIRKYDFSILVEGQMDIVMSHQAGYGNTVAVSGTGLTEYHLMLLEKLSKRLVMAFDGDRAGIDSCGRAAVLALKRGMDVKVTVIPVGKDPADCILEDASLWKDAVRNSKHVVDFFLDLVRKEATEKGWDARQLVVQTRDRVLPYIAVIRSATDRAHFERTVSSILGISEEAVREDVRSLMQNTQGNVVHTFRPQETKAPEKKKFSRKEDLEKTLAGFLFMQDGLETKVLDEDILKEKSEKYGIPLENLLARYSERKTELVEDSNRKYATSIDPVDIIDTLMKDLAYIYVSDELDMIRIMQLEAEREMREEDLEKLNERIHKLAKMRASLE